MASLPTPLPLMLLIILASLVLTYTVTAASRSGCTKTCDLFSQECLNEECICKRECHTAEPPRVCTNKGFEYPSRCHFFRDQCLCKSRSRLCRHRGVESDYILMYSACRRSGGSRAMPGEIHRPSTAPELLGRKCNNYNNRLAAWLGYALTLKLSESMVSLHEFETDEYLNGLYTNELLVFAPLAMRARRLAESLTYYSLETLQFDSRLPSLWFCILDSDTDGWLEEKELAQLSRVLLPQDACIEAFISGCLQGGRTVGLAAWQGPHCFRMREGDIKSSCDI